MSIVIAAALEPTTSSVDSKTCFSDCLPTHPSGCRLFDGLLWRSRVTKNSLREVNYDVKYSLQTENGNFAKATQSREFGDPKVVCRPVIILLSQLCGRVWRHTCFCQRNRGSCSRFLTDQSVLLHVGDTSADANRFFGSPLPIVHLFLQPLSLPLFCEPYEAAHESSCKRLLETSLRKAEAQPLKRGLRSLDVSWLRSPCLSGRVDVFSPAPLKFSHWRQVLT